MAELELVLRVLNDVCVLEGDEWVLTEGCVLDLFDTLLLMEVDLLVSCVEWIIELRELVKPREVETGGGVLMILVELDRLNSLVDWLSELAELLKLREVETGGGVLIVLDELEPLILEDTELEIVEWKVLEIEAELEVLEIALLEVETPSDE